MLKISLANRWKHTQFSPNFGIWVNDCVVGSGKDEIFACCLFALHSIKHCCFQECSSKMTAVVEKLVFFPTHWFVRACVQPNYGICVVLCTISPEALYARKWWHSLRPPGPDPSIANVPPSPLVSGRDPRAMDARGPVAGQRVPMAGGGMPGPGAHNMAANAPPPARPVMAVVSLFMLIRIHGWLWLHYVKRLLTKIILIHHHSSAMLLWMSFSVLMPGRPWRADIIV